MQLAQDNLFSSQLQIKNQDKRLNSICLAKQIICIYTNSHNLAEREIVLSAAKQLSNFQFLLVNCCQEKSKNVHYDSQQLDNLFDVDKFCDLKTIIEYVDLFCVLSSDAEPHHLKEDVSIAKIPTLYFGQESKSNTLLGDRYSYLVSVKPNLDLFLLLIKQFFTDKNDDISSIKTLRINTRGPASKNITKTPKIRERVEEPTKTKYSSLALSLQEKGDIEGAIQNYNEAIQLSLQQPLWVFSNLINCLELKGEFSRALQIAEQGLEIYPEAAELYRLQGLIHDRQRNIADVIVNYSKAIELEPNQPVWGYSVLADYYSVQGQYEEAINTAEKGIEIYPQEASLYRTLGVIYDRQGDLEKVIKNYKQTIELDDNQPFWVYCALIERLNTQNRSTEASAFGQQGIKLYPDQADLYLHLGAALKAKDTNELTSKFDSELESKFDWNFYVQYYEDISDISSYEEAYKHWSSYGKQENRICSEEQFYQVHNIDKSTLPEDFDWQEYLEINKDLQANISSKWPAILHFLLHGIKEKRPYSYKQFYYKIPEELVKSNPESNEQASQDLQFDWQFYVNYNCDINYITSYEEAYEHWINHGKNENRICSEDQFYQVHGLQKSDIPEDFDWKEYISLHLDLQSEINNQWGAVGHYMTLGIKEGRIYRLEQLKTGPQVAEKSVIKNIENFSIQSKKAKPTIVRRICQNLHAALSKAKSPEISTPKTKGQRLAVLFHLYYFDLWEEVCSYLKNIEEDFDLYINIVESIWQPNIHDQLRQDFPNARIIISKNQGKDIGGQLASMAQLDFSQYDVFCLFHTKKSPHISPLISDQWRKDLYDAILGSSEKVRLNLEIMRSDPSVGLIGSRYWRNTEVLNNAKYYNQLLDEFEIKPEARDCEYLSGTMMFVRPQIMKTIYDKYGEVELEDGDGKSLSFQKDGQIAHALERIIGNLVRHHGMRFFWQD